MRTENEEEWKAHEKRSAVELDAGISSLQFLYAYVSALLGWQENLRYRDFISVRR